MSWHYVYRRRPIRYKIVIFLDTTQLIKLGYYDGENWWWLMIRENVWRLNKAKKVIKWMSLSRLHKYIELLLVMHDDIGVPWFKRLLKKRKSKIRWEFY